MYTMPKCNQHKKNSACHEQGLSANFGLIVDRDFPNVNLPKIDMGEKELYSEYVCLEHSQTQVELIIMSATNLICSYLNHELYFFKTIRKKRSMCGICTDINALYRTHAKRVVVDIKQSRHNYQSAI